MQAYMLLGSGLNRTRRPMEEDDELQRLGLPVQLVWGKGRGQMLVTWPLRQALPCLVSVSHL